MSTMTDSVRVEVPTKVPVQPAAPPERMGRQAWDRIVSSIGIGLMTIVIFLVPSAAASAGSGSLDAAADAASPTIVDTDAVTDTVSDTTGNVTDTVSDTTGNVTDTVSDTTGNATDTVSDTTGNATDTVSDTTGNVTDTVSDTTGNVTDTVSESAAETAGTVSDTVDQASGAGQAGGGTNALSNGQGGSGSRSGTATSADSTRAASTVKPVLVTSAPTRVVSIAPAPAGRPADAATSVASAVSTAGQLFSLNVGACNLHRGGDAVQCSEASQDEGVLGLFLGMTGIALLFLFALGVAFASSGAASLLIARRLSGASPPA